MSDEPIERCPKCGEKVRRLIGGGLGVIFKGSGFYVTDNRRSGNGATDRHAVKTEEKSSNGKNGKAKNDSAVTSGAEQKSGTESKGGNGASSSKGSGSGVKESV